MDNLLIVFGMGCALIALGAFAIAMRHGHRLERDYPDFCANQRRKGRRGR